MASVTKPIPSDNSPMPKVYRWRPVVRSVPTNPSSRPSRIIPNAFTTLPWASTTAPISPSTIKLK
jgi:hypothetical protein